MDSYLEKLIELRNKLKEYSKFRGQVPAVRKIDERIRFCKMYRCEKNIKKLFVAETEREINKINELFDVEPIKKQ